MEVEHTVFEVELVDDIRTVAIIGDDAQPDVAELGYKGAGDAASGIGVIEPWDEVPKDGERGGIEGRRRVFKNHLWLVPLFPMPVHLGSQSHVPAQRLSAEQQTCAFPSHTVVRTMSQPNDRLPSHFTYQSPRPCPNNAASPHRVPAIIGLSSLGLFLCLFQKNQPHEIKEPSTIFNP